MGSREEDPLLSLMKERNIPLTRENYLTLAYMGDPPAWCPELETEIPEQFQDWDGMTFGGPKKAEETAESSANNLGRKGFHSLTVEEIEELGKVT
jgi:hypothetical protein